MTKTNPLTNQSAPRETSYRCLAGHHIPTELLDTLSERVLLDRGADVRICREHGAPIAVSIPGSIVPRTSERRGRSQSEQSVD